MNNRCKKMNKKKKEEIDTEVIDITESVKKPASKKKSTKKSSASKKTESTKVSKKDFANDIIDYLKSSGLDVDIGFLPETGANVKYWLDTGSYTWNFLMSGDVRKGAPVGRVIEVFGPSGTGKSLMCGQLACMAQKNDHTPFYVDTELAFTDDFAERLGADPQKIITAKGTRTIENFDKLFSGLVKQLAIKRKEGLNKPVSVFLDSMAMLSSKHEVDNPDKVDYSKMKKTRQFFRTYMDDCHRNDILFFVVNQIYDLIGVSFGEKTKATGGHGVAFASTIRIKLSNPKIIKEGESGNSDPRATIVKAKTIKNRVSVPERAVFIISSYEHGVDRYGGLFELMCDGKLPKTQYVESTHLNIIQRSGNKYMWPGVFVDEKGEDLKFNRTDFVDIFKSDEERYVEALQKEIDSRKNSIESEPLDEEETLITKLETAEGNARDAILEELEKIQDSK